MIPESEYQVDAKKLTGKFIVLDGPDGSGKSRQLRLLAEKLTASGLSVVCAKDPGGTAIGERIREVLLNHDLSNMDIRCETFLFMASRAQLVSEIIAPALEAGKVVLCDRFISATCAYQAAAGYDPKGIIELGKLAVGNTWPNLTVIVDLPVEEGFKRIVGRSKEAMQRAKDMEEGVASSDAGRDAMESRPTEFHKKVRELFLNLPSEYPGRIEVVEGLGTPDEVHERIMKVLDRVDF